MMNRRFLYMVLNNYMHAPSSWYTLHRIDPSLLFYHPTAPSSRAPQQAAEDARLPEPAMSFYPPPSTRDAGSMEFALLGRDMDQILAVDQKGRAVLYDDASRAVRTLPGMGPGPPGWWPAGVPLAIGAQDRALFIDADALSGQSDRGPRARQEAAAAHGRGGRDRGGLAMALPPCAPLRTQDRDQRHQRRQLHGHLPRDGRRGGARVGVHSGPRHVLAGHGERGLEQGRELDSPVLWARRARLPRRLVRRLGGKLGRDLRVGRAPGPDLAWGGFGVPEGFRGLDSHSYLFYLGRRRFCVAKAFQSTRWKECAERSMCCCCCRHDEYVGECTFAMFTGVEVDASWHRVAKHRSVQYSLGSDMFPVCVL